MDLKSRVTVIRKIGVEHPDPRTIKEAAAVIKSGGLVVYPTETCYGLAADATNPRAVRKIYKVKNRPASKPISIIVSSMRMMEKYGRVSRLIRAIAQRFIPGPLTIVIDKKDLPEVLAPRGIAFRVSSHPVAARLVRAAGRPITATSANISNHPPIYKSKEVAEIFDGKVDMILDCGDLKKVRTSTLVDARNWRVLRAGAVTEKEIVNFIEAATKR